MASEVSVMGAMHERVKQSVLDRLAALSQTSKLFVEIEQVFGRPSEGYQEEEIVPLRLRATTYADNVVDPQAYDFESPKQSWSIIVLGKPEPERLSADFVIRQFVSSPVRDGNTTELASALGYNEKYGFIRKGISFHRGVVTAEVFQVYKNNSSDIVGSPTISFILLKSLTDVPYQGGPTLQELRDQTCTAIRDFQRELKGLVDLGRYE